jgi:hypothetical protein
VRGYFYRVISLFLPVTPHSYLTLLDISNDGGLNRLDIQWATLNSVVLSAVNAQQSTKLTFNCFAIFQPSGLYSGDSYAVKGNSMVKRMHNSNQPTFWKGAAMGGSGLGLRLERAH